VILAVETSCDDTCAAVVEDGAIRANVISSQGVHDAYGAMTTAGVTLDDITLVGATRGPGLAGALLVGFQTAKAIAAARGLPFAAVDHLHGHVAATFLAPQRYEPPFLCLIASGGHTLLCDVQEPGRFDVIGTTLDDAAGEAFDKGARLLGLGYPGGPALQRLAEHGDSDAFDFPTGAGVSGLDSSFAGLKTALLYKVRDLGETEAAARAADLAAGYQRAIVGALVTRVERGLEATGHTRLALGGGVAANGPLRERVGALTGVEVAVPPPELCTDNAAMIAAAAVHVPARPYPDYLALDVYANGQAVPA